MPNDLLGQIHSSTAVTSPDWATFRGEVTGMYLLSGQGGEWDAQHLIREYNRNINSMYKSWTPTEPNATGLFLEPYNAGFSYQGTGNFRDYKWDTYSVDFDGVDEYVDTNLQPDFINTNATMSYWCKMDNFFGTQILGCHNSKRFYCGFNSQTAGMGVQDTNNLGIGADLSSYVEVGKWHHICLVADGGTATYYVDGVSRDTMSYTQASATNPDTDFFIGATSITDGAGATYATYLMEGKVDEVAIFDSALSTAQVVAIYNGGTPESLAPYSPFSWWRMGDGPLDNGNVAGNGLIGDQVNPTLGSELVTNGTMEADANWSDLNTPTVNERSTTEVYAGTYSRKFATDTNGDGIKSDTFTVTAGKVYKVTAHLYISAIAGVGNNIQMRLQNGNGADVGDNNQSNTSTGGWITETFYTRATVSGSSSFFKINQAGNGTATAYLDNVSVKEVNGYPGMMENMAASDIVADTP